ncbi:acyl-CoA-like ligand-binding transcription factor [Mycobacterium palustre]|uniref:acyl-CoA-like ligand-binding transcription factor n=1 Tax=Mycobacterium palustre TaxID=153971 RepID=UPI0035568562
MADHVEEMERDTRESSALRAWTLLSYLRFEAASAETIAPRLADLTVDDPRPRLIGALAMAAVRIALDDWLRDGGSLTDRRWRRSTVSADRHRPRRRRVPRARPGPPRPIRRPQRRAA